MVKVPVVGLSNPPKIFNKVLLPQPLLPTTKTRPLSSRLKQTLSNALTSILSFILYTLVKLFALM